MLKGSKLWHLNMYLESNYENERQKLQQNEEKKLQQNAEKFTSSLHLEFLALIRVGTSDTSFFFMESVEYLMLTI